MTTQNTTIKQQEPIIIKGENLTADVMLKEALAYTAKANSATEANTQTLVQVFNSMIDDRAKAKADKAIAKAVLETTEKYVAETAKNANALIKKDQEIATLKHDLKISGALNKEVLQDAKFKVATTLRLLETSLDSVMFKLDLTPRWSLDKKEVAVEVRQVGLSINNLIKGLV